MKKVLYIALLSVFTVSCKGEVAQTYQVVAKNSTYDIPLTIEAMDKAQAISEARKALRTAGIHSDSINKLKFNIKSN